MRRMPHTNGRARPAGRAGFTLIEAVVATTIVGLGVASLFVSLKAGTEVNAAAADLTQAVFVAQEVREWTLMLPFTDPDEADQGNPPGPDGADPQDWVDDLDDLLDVVYTPPHNGSGEDMYDLDGWSQHITLTWRDPKNLAQVVTAGSTNVVYVQVDVSRSGRDLLTTGWFVTGGQQP